MDKKIVSNYIYNIAYQLLLIIAPLITAPYISRVLHSEGVGLYSYTETIASAFALFAGLGFNTYGQREVAYYQDDRQMRSMVFYEICGFRSILTACVVVAYVVFCFFYREYTAFLLPQIFIIIAVMFDVSWYFQGMENFKITVLRNIVVKIATIILTFAFVKNEDDTIIYILIHSISILASNLFYCFIITRYIEKVRIVDLHPSRHIKGTIEFFIPLIAVKIYSYLDKIMLGYYMVGTSENGFYEQARKITALIVAMIVALNTVMMSRISNLYANEKKDEILQFYQQTFDVILLLVSPICVGLLLASDNFAIWFFGSDFYKVGTLLKLSSLLILFMCIGNFVGVQFLGPTGLQNKMTVAYITAAVINVILNMVLIPLLFSIGAMIASIIAEAISCGIQIYYLKISEYNFKLLKNAWKYILSSGIMASGIMLLHASVDLNGAISTISDAVLGIIIYCICLVAVKESNINIIISLIIKSKKQM